MKCIPMLCLAAAILCAGEIPVPNGDFSHGLSSWQLASPKQGEPFSVEGNVLTMRRGSIDPKAMMRIFQDIPVAGGRKITVKAFLRNGGKSDDEVVMFIYHGDGKKWNDPAPVWGPRVRSADWQEVSVPIELAGNESVIRISISASTIGSVKDVRVYDEPLAGPLPEGTFRLTPAKPAYTVEADIDPSAEHVYGISYEAKGVFGLSPSIDLYETFDEKGVRDIQEMVINIPAAFPLSGNDWEQKHIEVVTRKGNRRLSFRFRYSGPGEDCLIRSVRTVKGGFPGKAPIAEAPYFDWIASLKCSAGTRSPLIRFTDSGSNVYSYSRDVTVTAEEDAQYRSELEPYMRMPLNALLALVPDRHPFQFHGGYVGWNTLFVEDEKKIWLCWDPSRPDILSLTNGEAFDVSARFPMDGADEAIAPSGMRSTYPYHRSKAAAVNDNGRHIYLDEFMLSTRMNAFARAGYLMAALYRMDTVKNAEYGRRSAAILWKIARSIPDWVVIGRPLWNSPANEKTVQRPDSYLWMTWIYSGHSDKTVGGMDWYLPASGYSLWLARHFDMLAESELWNVLAKEHAADVRRETENGLLHLVRMGLKNDAYYRLNELVTFNNTAGSLVRAYGAFGTALNCPDLVHHSVRKITAMVERTFLYDGIFPESRSYGAQQFFGTIGAQGSAAAVVHGYTDPPGYRPEEGSRFDDLDLVRDMPFVKRIADALDRFVYPDGSPVLAHDSWAKNAAFYAEPLPPPPNTGRPQLFPAFGHASLGTGAMPNAIEAHLHFSGAYNHAHQDMLDLTLWAYGTDLVSDIGYSHLGQYHVSSVAHNLVVVDRMTQQTRAVHAGNLLLLHARDGAVQAVQADQGATKPYPQCSIYRRTLLLVPFAEGRNAVVDIFEVNGGSVHEWMANGSADYRQEQSPSFPTSPRESLAADGVSITDPTLPTLKRDVHGTESRFYGAFRNVRSARCDVPLRVTFTASSVMHPEIAERFTPAEKAPRLALHWVSPTDAEMMLCEAPANRFPKEANAHAEAARQWSERLMKKVIVRRTGGSASRFCAVWEPYSGAPFLTGVTPHMLENGSALTMSDGNTSCTILYRAPEAAGMSSAGGITGNGSVMSLTTGSESAVDLYDGTDMDTDLMRIELKANGPFPITVFGAERGVSTARMPPPPEDIIAAAAGEQVRLMIAGTAVWLPLTGMEVRNGEALVSFGYDAGSYDRSGVWKEAMFPFRSMQGELSLMLPSWMNIKLRNVGERTEIRYRSGAKARVFLKASRMRTAVGGSVKLDIRDGGVSLILPPTPRGAWATLLLAP